MNVHHVPRQHVANHADDGTEDNQAGDVHQQLEPLAVGRVNGVATPNRQHVERPLQRLSKSLDGVRVQYRVHCRRARCGFEEELVLELQRTQCSAVGQDDHGTGNIPQNAVNVLTVTAVEARGRHGEDAEDAQRSKEGSVTASTEMALSARKARTRRCARGRPRNAST